MEDLNQKKCIRIAMISTTSDPLAPVGGRQAGGASIYIYELARMLSRNNIHVDVYTRWDNRGAAQIVRFAKRARLIRIKAGPRHFIPQESLESYTPEFLEHFLAFMRENKLKYNLVHSHQYMSGRIGVQLKEILKIPLVHTFHSLGKVKEQAKISHNIPFERFEIEKMIMTKADAMVATSPYEKVNAIKAYSVIGENIYVIPTGFNLKRFSHLDKSLVRKRLNINPNEHVIVFAARMDENKGGLTLLKTVKWLKTYHKKIYDDLMVFMFTGDPRKTRKKDNLESGFKKKLVKGIADFEIGDHVKLHSAIEQNELHRYYGAADIVIMPSYYEGLPLVSIEAMATGTPVVASKVGGLQWAVQEGITGLHAKAGNEKDFGQKVVYLLKHPKVIQRMAENSYIMARQSYSWDIITEKMIGIYNNLTRKE
jgi:D-inositol-3-phosphate glycosyltransferase